MYAPIIVCVIVLKCSKTVLLLTLQHSYMHVHVGSVAECMLLYFSRMVFAGLSRECQSVWSAAHVRATCPSPDTVDSWSLESETAYIAT